MSVQGADRATPVAERGRSLPCETSGLGINPLRPACDGGSELAANVGFRPRRHFAGDGYAVLSHLPMCPLLGFHLHNVDLLALVSMQMRMGAFVQENIERFPSDGPRGLDQLS
jgi:hypothetical protein